MRNTESFRIHGVVRSHDADLYSVYTTYTSATNLCTVLNPICLCRLCNKLSAAHFLQNGILTTCNHSAINRMGHILNKRISNTSYSRLHAKIYFKVYRRASIIQNNWDQGQFGYTTIWWYSNIPQICNIRRARVVGCIYCLITIHKASSVRTHSEQTTTWSCVLWRKNSSAFACISAHHGNTTEKR